VMGEREGEISGVECTEKRKNSLCIATRGRDARAGKRGR
jgi:hypothetical protein